MAIQHHTKLSKESVSEAEQPSRQPLTINAQKIMKTSQYSTHNIDQFGYSGTDNGLVNMSTTVPSKAKRYKFHLPLYDEYQVLEEDEIEVKKEDLGYLHLQKKFAINSEDVDVGRGVMKQRKQLEKEKKTKEEKRVTRVETELLKVPLTSCSTIQQFATVEELYIPKRICLYEKILQLC
ncbi:unnamed protein product [Mucor hiemalis]